MQVKKHPLGHGTKLHKCILCAVVCWSVAAVSVAYSIGSVFSDGGGEGFRLPQAAVVPVSSPANPAFSATANDFTLAPPDTVHTSPGASDAASPSEGLTDKQLAQLENGRPQQDGSGEGAAEEPDSPPEDNGTSDTGESTDGGASGSTPDTGNPEALLGAEDGFVYYRQDWSEYKNEPYGNRTLGSYGCGPTNMAMIISSLTGKKVSPITLARYSESHGMFVSGSGTSYSFITSVAEAYGLKVTQCSRYDYTALRQALADGKLALTVMGPGIFSYGGHFLTYRGITDDGNILIADSINYDRSTKEWSVQTLASQMKIQYYWIFELK